VVLFIALLIGYPWHLLSAGALIYLLSLPAGWLSYRRLEQAATSAQPATTVTAGVSSEPTGFNPPPVSSEADDRPTRLN